LADQLWNGITEKIELDPISTEERLRQLFALYGCNVIFTEQRNFTKAKRQRKNGNGMMETGHKSHRTHLPPNDVTQRPSTEFRVKRGLD